MIGRSLAHYRITGAIGAGGPHLVIAATYGQLAEHEAAHEALRDLLVLKPDIVLIARDALARWYPPDLVEQLIDGLRKAGLDIAHS